MRASPRFSKVGKLKGTMGFFLLKKNKLGLGRWLRKGGHCSCKGLEFHSKYHWGLTITCNSNYKGPNISFWLPCGTHIEMERCFFAFFFFEQTIAQKKKNDSKVLVGTESNLDSNLRRYLLNTHIKVRHGDVCLEGQHVRGWGERTRNSMSSWMTHQVWGQHRRCEIPFQKDRKQCTRERVTMDMSGIYRRKTMPTAQLQLLKQHFKTN